VEGEVRFSFALPSLLPLFFDRNIACPSNISIPPSNTGFLPRIFSIEFLSLVLQQLHFPDLTHGCLFDHTKLSRAHILELGCVPLKPPPHILKFPQSSTHLRSMKNQRRNGTPRARARTPGAQIYGDGHSRARPSPPQKLGLSVHASSQSTIPPLQRTSASSSCLL